MYIVYRGTPHFLFSYPVLSILGMFMMTLGEFSDLYADFDNIRQPNAAKVMARLVSIVFTFNFLWYNSFRAWKSEMPR